MINVYETKHQNRQPRMSRINISRGVTSAFRRGNNNFTFMPTDCPTDRKFYSLDPLLLHHIRAYISLKIGKYKFLNVVTLIAGPAG